MKQPSSCPPSPSLILASLLSLLLIVRHATAQTSCPFDHTSTLEVHVTENDVGALVFKAMDHFSPGGFGVDLNFRSQAENMAFFNNFVVPEPKNTFQGEDMTITTSITSFDRETIAESLGNTVAPVIFNITIQDLLFPGDFVVRSCIILVIYVEDINDNSPMFPANSVPFIMVQFEDDNTDLTQARTLPHAKDDDEGANGTSTYRLVDDKGVFYLDVKRDEMTEEIIVVSLKHSRPLDLEEAPGYNLTLVAEEGIENGAFAELDVRVNIKPICDEPPFFEMYTYLPSVPEDTTVGMTIVNATAFDNDTGVGGDLAYTIQEIIAISDHNSIHELAPGDSPFVLDSESGVLVLNETLDREETLYYDVMIRAEDGCGLSATATVRVTVEDVNDNAPDITYLGLRDVLESIQLTSDIGVVSVRDPDEGANANVTIELFERINGELVESDTFRISDSSQDPILRLKQELNREEKEEYYLVVMATDRGDPPMSAEYALDITVGDVNDNDPVFSAFPALFVLPEDRPINTHIHDFTASDDDASPSNTVSFDVLESSDMFPNQHLFKISLSGELMVADVLDREAYEEVSIHIAARDAGDPQRSAFAVVNFSILDQNDNKPTITFPNATLSIPESMTVGDMVTTVLVEDLDATPQHRTHNFTLLPSPAPFSIDLLSGIILVSGELDRETTPSYTITVEVKDSKYVDTRAITIEVTDVNDIRPRFDREGGYEGAVSENLNVSTSVLRLMALDEDIQSEFTFEFVSGDHLERFFIDEAGVVRTAVPLDREQTQNYTFFARVSDGQFFSSDLARIFISVVDKDDHIPVAIGTPYNFEVEERLPMNTFVGQVTVLSLDAGVNGQVRFQFLGNSTSTGQFLIEPYTGVIRTTRALDRETSTEPIILNVEFEDGDFVNPVSVMVSVRVTDVNDEAPRFVAATNLVEKTPEMPIPANKSVSVHLVDSFSQGAPFLRVRAYDADIAPNNKTKYELSADNNQFHIGETSGNLSLTSSLDFDDQQLHTIAVFVKDADEGSFLDEMTVVVHVVDVPPPCLVFPTSLSPQQQVLEEVAIGTTVVSFEVTNSEGASLSGLQYTLTRQDGSESLEFYIVRDPVSFVAAVKTKARINRDGPASPLEYILNVTVCDGQSTTGTCDCVTVILTVSVEDINDEPPQFRQSSYEFSVEERNDVNEVVGPNIFEADDQDAGANGEVELRVQDSPYVPFSVDNTGQLRVLQALDFETTRQYDFMVYATDRGSPALSGSASVLVRVRDVNDNDPVFDPSQLRNFMVSENTVVHSTVATIAVDDDDSEAFGEVELLFAGSTSDDIRTHFDLKLDGSIILLTSLDREARDAYSFTAVARDGGSPQRTARAVININVTDYNDHIPVFTNTSFSVTIPETFPLSVPFTSLHATDGDVGTNAQVRYALANSSLEDIFCIDATTGSISLCEPSFSSAKRLEVVDYERDTRYEIAIVAFDQGVPRLLQTATLTVNIEPVNEHWPAFDTGLLVAYIEEGLPANSIVARLQAYDDDRDSLEYVFTTLAGPSGHFHWDLETRAVVTSRVLSFDTNRAYTLRLRASDRDFNNSVVLEVIIVNVNNHHPVFVPSSSPKPVSELSEPGSVVGRVHATDQDNMTSAAVVYSVSTTGNNYDNTFTVDPLTGDIIQSRSLDYESRTNFTLSLTATDTGFPQRTSSVLQLTVLVKNENDNSPRFLEDSYSLMLLENQLAGSCVGSVVAADLDSPPFNAVRYSLQSGVDMFSIGEESGEICSTVEIDREQLSENPISFVVEASDGTNSVSVPVSVLILDENDNGPTFSQRRFLFAFNADGSLSDQMLPLRPEVLDPDLGENAEFELAIVSSPDALSVSLSDLGALFLTQPLPGGSGAQTEYNISVRASDGEKTDVTVVQLLVETDSQHHPRFQPDVLHTNPIFENVVPGPQQVVFDLSGYVVDADTGDTVTFRVEPDLPEFSLDSESGLLTLRQPLDFEQKERYELTVFATDSSQRTATASLSVTVLDFNDEAPTFISPFPSIVLSPVADNNVEMFRVMAEDRDTEEAGMVSYAIVNSDLFDVDQKTGIVRNKGSLSAGLMTSFILRAYDSGRPLMSSNITINVTIAEPGDMAPEFGGSLTFPLQFMELEDLPPDTSLLSFATAPGVEFFLVSSSAPEGLFAVEGASLILNGSLNYETETQYVMILEARREQTNPLRHFSTYGKVTLMVEDVNDNEPVFAHVDDKFLDENMAQGFVFSVHAEDADSGTNGVVNYLIVSGNTGRVFDIDEMSGDISLVSSLDRETTANYVLEIRASDGAFPNNLEAQTTVSITVNDLNDYVPTFPGNFTINVFESPHTGLGSYIGAITAEDLDSGRAPVYSFSLLSARHLGTEVVAPVEPVTVDLDSGVVRTAIELDRETADYFLLEVTANDREHTTTTFLTINVLDVNDHTPSISAPLDINICEHQPIGFILTSAISASDEDRGRNGAVQFRLGADWPEGWFSIDPLSGVIRVAGDIVYQELHSFSGTVFAEDLGSPSRSVSAVVNVRIIDINDHTPQFGQTSYNIPISVGTQHGTKILTFVTTDADAGVNSAVAVRIPDYYSQVPFGIRVNENQLELFLSLPSGELQVGATYTFQVDVINLRPTPYSPHFVLSSYADVTVVVYPINEHSPVLPQSSYVVLLPEDHDRDAAVLQLMATDDDGDDILYSITDPAAATPFTIDRNTGRMSITAGEAVDYETETEYHFTVEVKDTGEPARSMTVDVAVQIQDVNEFRPVFVQRSYSAVRDETDVLEGVVLLEVRATDADAGSWGRILYSIDESLPFTINTSSGVLTAKRALDYDTKPSYQFPVRAFNPGMEDMFDSVNATVTLQAVNEHPPVFESPPNPGQANYEFTVTPNMSSGELIGSIQAIDSDSGPDGVLVYTILNDEARQYIRIETVNNVGNIYLIVNPTVSDMETSVAKRQTVDDSYFTVRAEIQASDGTLNAVATVDLRLHNSFSTVPRPVTPTPSAIPYEIIAVVVVAVVVAVLVFVAIVVTAMICRMKRRSRKEKIGRESESGMRNNVAELQGRYVARGGDGSSTAQTTTGFGHTHSTSGTNSSRHSYGSYADDEESFRAGSRYHARSPVPSLPHKSPLRRSFEIRSTSDLASTVGTEALGTSQETGPYTKAQLAAIYAANAELLANSGSQDSVHMFGSEGGGEADGEVDIDNILLSKSYDLDDDELSTTMAEEMPASLDTDSSGNLDVPPVEEREEPGFGQNMAGWAPRGNSIADTINELVNYAGAVPPQRRQLYEPAMDASQGTSLYEGSTGASLRDSHSSLIRHQPMASQQTHDYYFPDTPETRPSHPQHHPARSHRYGSATVLMEHGLERHHVPGPYYSQDVPYSHPHSHMHFLPPRSRTPPSETPTEGTVTPHRALASDYDPITDTYLTSSSTSIASTNCSQRGYPHPHALPPSHHHLGMFH